MKALLDEKMSSGIPHVPFYFIRHGETDWNKEHRAMGQKDIPLNQTGIAQAKKAADILKNTNFKTIISSPLSRALMTAKTIAEKNPQPIEIIPELQECNWGSMEGQHKKHGYIDNWRKGTLIDGAEEYHKFSQRVLDGLLKALTYQAPVLIVSHGGIYWIIQEQLKLASTKLDNCNIIFHNPPTLANESWITYNLV
jgi:probable phosphoglycerate mutase